MLVRIMAWWDGADVSADPDGFVHLSWPEQVAGTIQRHYVGAAGLTFLIIDEQALPPGALHIEDTSGHGPYPHLYATLPATAVVRAVSWRAGEPIVL